MKLLEWTWENYDGKWELYLDNKMPELLFPTAVIGICFYQDSILLTKSKRWWELPCGHIEENESPQEALLREIKEETWANTASYKLIWNIKILPNKPIQRKDGTYYPYPFSYMPLYICECENIWDFTGEEILETKQLKIDEIDSFDFTNREIVQLLLKYR